MLLALLVGLVGISADARTEDVTVLWPEQQRSFLHDGPGHLLSEEQREALLATSQEERDDWIADFLGQDPIPETPANELVEGIRRRRALVRGEFLSLLDDRARLLFLQGAPLSRATIECGQTFRPLQIWTYRAAGSPARLVLYQPSPGKPYRLWLPLDTKYAVYTEEMAYLLEQWEEMMREGWGRAKRFDLQTCPDTRQVDDATGVDGLRGYREGRPKDREVLSFVQPPADLAAWARRAAETLLPEAAPSLALSELEIFFPERWQQRILTHFRLSVPAGTELGVATENDKQEVILGVDGALEQEGQLFEEFKVRFKLKPPGDEVPIALTMERALRPDRNFVVHLKVRDEVSGGEAFVSRGFRVPSEPQAVDLPPVPEEAIVVLGEELALRVLPGHDSLLLVPPSTEVVLGLWRAEALVTGSRITRVVFLVDGKQQMSRTRRPFSAEVRLAKFPTEQVVRAEGYDDSGNLVASDEVVLNQPRGSLRVRILEPRRGAAVAGRVLSRAEVVVPEDRRVEKVEFLIDEELIRTLTKPPWEAEIEVVASGEVSYLTVAATLDDGTRAEEVRFLNAPRYLEEVEVNLVELFTTVTDRSGRLIRGLEQADFQVFEDERPQKIGKFDLVEDLPLTIGFTIDTSGSMVASLPEAQRAAIGFLENILTRRDRAFAVSFSDRPVLLIPPTDDITAVEEALKELRSVGWTALHDAVVTSLYYFRGVRGRRALILLSDGDDTASSIAFRDAVEYARRSGVAIFCVGVDVGGLNFGIRKKLTELAQDTGGRAFFISQAEELRDVYREIEEELRSQYLVAYTSDRPAGEGGFRAVEVKVKGGKLKARTIRGYYP